MTAGETGPAIRARALCHAYRIGWRAARREVLRGIDLELPRGAALGLLGPNGSGKSTLLRLCAGLEKPDSGELQVLGDPPMRAAARARVGYCPEDSPWPGELGCSEALELRAAADGQTAARARELARMWLARVGLEHAARTRLSECSRGMRRRFGLAQALLGNPELLLLDEPSAGLDATGLALYDGLLAEARARGATLVLCSHQLSDLTRHCEQYLVLLDGRVAAAGTLQQLAERSDECEIQLRRAPQLSLERLRGVLESSGAAAVRIAPGPSLLLSIYARAAHTTCAAETPPLTARDPASRGSP